MALSGGRAPGALPVGGTGHGLVPVPAGLARGCGRSSAAQRGRATRQGLSSEGTRPCVVLKPRDLQQDPSPTRVISQRIGLVTYFLLEMKSSAWYTRE